MNTQPAGSSWEAEPPPIFLLIDRAMRSNDLPRAIALAHQALDAGHADPVLFGLRAHWRKHNGRLEEALSDLKRAHALAPGNAVTLSETADCLNVLGLHRDAIAAASEALAVDPALASAWYHKAFAHQMLSELDDAKAGFLEAVRLDPNLPDAFARLAGLAAVAGENGAAREYSGRALALRPNHPIASLTLAGLDLSDGDLAAAEPRLLTLVREPHALTRATAFAHLGDLRDRQDRTGEAFAAYRESGAAWRAAYPSSGKTACEWVQGLIAAFEALPDADFSGESPAMDEAANLAFIIGFPRSGTTLLGHILASRRDDVAVLEERPLLAKAVADFLQQKDGPAMLLSLPQSELDAYRADFWERVRHYGAEPKGKLFVDQTAFNTCYLPVILRLFPQAKIVFALRDPRDVVFSCFRRQFGPNPFTLDLHAPESSAKFYETAMRFADLSRRKLGLKPFTIRNEDLIADFDGQTRALFSHLGLRWDQSLRDYHVESRKRTLITRSATQVRRGLSRDGVGQWRRYRDDLAPVLPMLAPWVEWFGYDAD